ncbi:MAG TPA: LysR substrate-binding domain-containing protein [Clostridia bacterium]|nr:LysR substrate-binding domain-containing protein [Clostridia bacterium]
MEIHQLRYFVAVAQEGSFSRAATKVRVAQPSLSQQIQKLEATLGHRLFDRLTRRVILTEAGHGLLPFAHRILNELSSAQRFVEDRDKAPAGTVKIGILPTIAPYLVKELVGRTGQELARVDLTVVEEVTEQLVQLVDTGEVDLAVISTCRTGPGIHVERWAQEELVAALPEGHTLAGKKAISWRHLREEPVLLLHESHCLSGQIQKSCARHRLRHKRAGVLQLGTLLEMVAAGTGISLVPRMAVGQQVKGVVFRPFQEMVPVREINLLRNASRYQSKAALAVAEIGRRLVCERV